MNCALWMKFLEEDIEEVQEVLLAVGVHGLLEAFENWLYRNGHVVSD